MVIDVLTDVVCARVIIKILVGVLSSVARADVLVPVSHAVDMLAELVDMLVDANTNVFAEVMSGSVFVMLALLGELVFFCIFCIAALS